MILDFPHPQLTDLSAVKRLIQQCNCFDHLYSQAPQYDCAKILSNQSAETWLLQLRQQMRTDTKWLTWPASTNKEPITTFMCVCVCNISESNPSHTDHSSCFNSTYNSTQLTTPKKEWFNKRKEAKKLMYIPDKQHERTVMYNSSSAL